MHLSMRWTPVRYPGEAVSPEILTLGSAAWDEFVELQAQDKEAYLLGLEASIGEAHRVEAVVHGPRSRGREVAAVFVLALDYDVHVGPCIAVMLQYATPAFRHKGCAARVFQAAKQACRDNNIPYLAWTHRKRDFTYETRYRRIR